MATAKNTKPETLETTPGQNGSAPLVVEINFDNLTIGDLELIDKAGRRDLPISDMLDLLDRIVVGGARQLPLAHMQAIFSALNEKIAEAANPGN